MDHKPSWVNCAVTPRFSWPNCEVELPFEDRKVVLQPRKEELAATVSIYDGDGLSLSEGGALLSRFLSRLAWSEDRGVVENFLGGSGNPDQPGRMGQGTFETSCWGQIEPNRLLYIPVPLEPKAELALALYREAMGVNSIPYSFLGYFKILNILFPDGERQKRWVNRNLEKVTYAPALKRLEELRADESNIGQYLYKQGRCAVAHAYDQTQLVNPDEYDHRKRLEDDLWLMKSLAAICVEGEFGVKSASEFLGHATSDERCAEQLLVKCDELINGRVVYKYYDR